MCICVNTPNSQPAFMRACIEKKRIICMFLFDLNSWLILFHGMTTHTLTSNVTCSSISKIYYLMPVLWHMNVSYFTVTGNFSLHVAGKTCLWSWCFHEVFYVQSTVGYVQVVYVMQLSVVHDWPCSVENKVGKWIATHVTFSRLREN